MSVVRGLAAADLEEIEFPTILITRPEMKDRLREAGRALRGLRSPKEIGALVSVRACWPDIPADYWVSYGTARLRYKPSPPTAEQIGRLDEVLVWLLKLDTPDRAFIGAWMMHAGWTVICQQFHISRQWGWKRLDAICGKLVKIAEEAMKNSG